MAITIKNISKASSNRERITVEDSVDVVDEATGTCKTYSFYMPDMPDATDEERAIEAKIRLEKVIVKEKKEVSDDEALKQVYASKLSEVDPSKVEV